MDKAKVLETLDGLPEEFSTEELIDKLLFIEKVERGMKDVDMDKVLTMTEVKERNRESIQELRTLNIRMKEQIDIDRKRVDRMARPWWRIILGLNPVKWS